MHPLNKILKLQKSLLRERRVSSEATKFIPKGVQSKFQSYKVVPKGSRVSFEAQKSFPRECRAKIPHK
jgi:hypothetical protein